MIIRVSISDVCTVHIVQHIELQYVILAEDRSVLTCAETVWCGKTNAWLEIWLRMGTPTLGCYRIIIIISACNAFNHICSQCVLPTQHLVRTGQKTNREHNCTHNNMNVTSSPVDALQLTRQKLIADIQPPIVRVYFVAMFCPPPSPPLPQTFIW